MWRVHALVGPATVMANAAPPVVVVIVVTVVVVRVTVAIPACGGRRGRSCGPNPVVIVAVNVGVVANTAVIVAANVVAVANAAVTVLVICVVAAVLVVMEGA